MILAGIDEAGLGPKLGPLVVASAAFWIDDSCNPETTSLWDILSQTTTSSKSRHDRRLLITDSKIVHSSRGFPALKDVVLNFSRVLNNGRNPSNLRELACILGAEAQIPDIARSRWFQPIMTATAADPRLELPPQAVFNLQHEQAAIRHLNSRILTARSLNALFSHGLNKAEVLLLQTGRHIRHIINTYPEQSIHIVVDKQGGRNYYAPYLMDLLDGEWIETIRESSGSSLYKIRNNIRIEFRPKADRTEFTVALASITAKFFREILMEEFNKFFTSGIPEIRPTAGYPEDAKRYYSELTEFLHTAKIGSHEIWRER